MEIVPLAKYKQVVKSNELFSLNYLHKIPLHLTEQFGIVGGSDN